MPCHREIQQMYIARDIVVEARAARDLVYIYCNIISGTGVAVVGTMGCHGVYRGSLDLIGEDMFWRRKIMNITKQSPRPVTKSVWALTSMTFARPAPSEVCRSAPGRQAVQALPHQSCSCTSITTLLAAIFLELLTPKHHQQHPKFRLWS